MSVELKKYTAEEVAKHKSASDIWMIYNGKVYDVSKFLEEHPGGEEVMLEQAGIDATQAFNEIGHSPDAEALLEKMLIGELDASAEKPAEAKKEAKAPAQGSKPSAPAKKPAAPANDFSR